MEQPDNMGEGTVMSEKDQARIKILLGRRSQGQRVLGSKDPLPLQVDRSGRGALGSTHPVLSIAGSGDLPWSPCSLAHG